MASEEFMKKMQDLGEIMKETADMYDVECEQYWKGLEKKDQLKAFYSVMKRVCKGELEQQASYRYILYNIFEFGPEAYSIGMECGYMDLHNCIDPELYKRALDD